MQHYCPLCYDSIFFHTSIHVFGQTQLLFCFGKKKIIIIKSEVLVWPNENENEATEN